MWGGVGSGGGGKMGPIRHHSFLRRKMTNECKKRQEEKDK